MTCSSPAPTGTNVNDFRAILVWEPSLDCGYHLTVFERPHLNRKQELTD
jgi:hypothetical protein